MQIAVCIVLAGIPAYADRGFQPYLRIEYACDKCSKIPQNIIIIPSLSRQVCRWTMITID